MVAASGWSAQMATVKSEDALVYILFGAYIPFVLLMFSLGRYFSPHLVLTSSAPNPLLLLMSPYSAALHRHIRDGLHQNAGNHRHAVLGLCLRRGDTERSGVPGRGRSSQSGCACGHLPDRLLLWLQSVIVLAVVGHSLATMRAPTARRSPEDPPSATAAPEAQQP